MPGLDSGGELMTSILAGGVITDGVWTKAAAKLANPLVATKSREKSSFDCIIVIFLSGRVPIILPSLIDYVNPSYFLDSCKNIFSFFPFAICNDSID